MSELDRDARRILSLARAARSPSHADRERISQRLGATLGVVLAAEAAGSTAAEAAVSSTAAEAAGSAAAEAAVSSTAAEAAGSTAAEAAVSSTAAEAAVGSTAAEAAVGSTAGVAGGTGTATAAKGLLGGLAVKWLAGGLAVTGLVVGGYLQLAGPASRGAPAAVAVPTVRVSSSAGGGLRTLEPSRPDPQVPDTPAEPPGAGVSPRGARASAVQARRAPGLRVQARGPGMSTELDLLHRARAAWRAETPARALRLLERHRSRFPESALALERDALRVLALCDLGQTARARRLAQRVQARAPRSPLRAAVEQSCAGR